MLTYFEVRNLILTFYMFRCITKVIGFEGHAN